MNLTILTPKWLVRKIARPKPPPRARYQLKQRQLLKTLPTPEPPVARFQDDDSPPGYRIQWRL
ncbi:MAG TPA: hypothetical protein VK742_15795 [Candidatus Sulfotelmatobacter sp.]|jgi:hypothetical protein|nr:hypothetical protein [Candidatus Sulfotelmatobacter sp.]